MDKLVIIISVLLLLAGTENSKAQINNQGSQIRAKKIKPLNNKHTYSVEDAQKNPEQVKKLDLSNRQLIDFPLSVAELSEVEYLDLSNNQLTKINADLTRLKKLKYINLSNNKFTTFPKELYHLENIEEINFSNNNISILPEDIYRMPKIRVLNLNKNHPHLKWGIPYHYNRLS